MKRIIAPISVALISLLLTALYKPYKQLPTLAQGNCRSFSETGKQVCGRFLEYWTQNGGLAQQGLPLSTEFNEVSDLNGQTYTVQYIERAVLEKHPENARPYDVLLSQLGTFQFKRKYPGGDPSGGGQQPPPAPTLPPMPPPPAGEQPVTITGNGDWKSPPFNLQGGNYVSEWTARVPSGRSECIHYLYLNGVNVEGFFGEDLANASSSNPVRADDPRSQSRSTNIYDIPPGQFYVESNTSCSDWSVTIRRQ